MARAATSLAESAGSSGAGSTTAPLLEPSCPPRSTTALAQPSPVAMTRRTTPWKSIATCEPSCSEANTSGGRSVIRSAVPVIISSTSSSSAPVVRTSPLSTGPQRTCEPSVSRLSGTSVWVRTWLMRSSTSSSGVCERLIRKRSTSRSVNPRITAGSYDEGPSVQMICTRPAPSFNPAMKAPPADVPGPPSYPRNDGSEPTMTRRMALPQLRRRSAGPLPNFLLIGAMKAGTTSMYHYLRAHPQVYMPTFKAPEFFAGKALSSRGVDWYRRQFADVGPGAVAIGEASNVYTKYPHYSGVPARIAELIPDVRLLYIVRDPVARIRSHYQTRAVEGSEKLPLGEAVASNSISLDYSRYAMQIEQYLEHFSREQLLVTTAEALRNDRDSVM